LEDGSARVCRADGGGVSGPKTVKIAWVNGCSREILSTRSPHPSQPLWRRHIAASWPSGTASQGSAAP
jgi:hypothetical protein